MEVVKIEGLFKKYGNRVLFENFNASILEGEKVAICGKSGSGKSTLLNILMGIDSDYKGKVVVDNYSNPKIGKTSIDYYRNTVSILLQDYGLVNEKNIIDNVKIGVPNANENEINAKMDRLGLKQSLKIKVNELSGGEKQRIGLLRALMKNSKILLCDEPTGNLDGETSEEIIDIILRLDKTILLITHDMTIAKKCDRIIYI